MGGDPGQAATSQVYGFLVAGVVFLASLGALAWATHTGPDPAPGDHAAQRADARKLAAVLVGDPGAGWLDPDTLARFGLADAPGGGLSGDHLQLLDNATLAAITDDQLQYEEARLALGLDGSAGFRIRVVPLDFEAVLLQHDFTHVKALYIGDFGNVGTTTLGMGQGTIANANTQLNLSMATNTGLERTVVDLVGVDFDNHMHLTLSAPDVRVQTTSSPPTYTPLLTHLGMTEYDGDVLYDNKQFLDAVLPTKLGSGGYDLLVLGSGIDHSTLTAQSVKTSIDNFVRAGGTLMVFGSPGANFNWMQPIMDLSAASVSGPVTAVDPDHPILAAPHDLAWASYPTNNLGWTIGVPSNFENVLMQGGKPVIAISKDGAIGSGHVFLSSIQPRAIATNLGTAEASAFMFNVLLYDRDAVRDPTVEFGPDPPERVPVSSVVRTGIVQEGTTQIPVRIELLAWGTV